MASLSLHRLFRIQCCPLAHPPMTPVRRSWIGICLKYVEDIFTERVEMEIYRRGICLLESASRLKYVGWEYAAQRISTNAIKSLTWFQSFYNLIITLVIARLVLLALWLPLPWTPELCKTTSAQYAVLVKRWHNCNMHFTLQRQSCICPITTPSSNRANFVNTARLTRC